MEMEKLTQGQADERVEHLREQLVHLLNTEVMEPHRKGVMMAADALYVCATALGLMLAHVIAEQLMPKAWGRAIPTLDRVMDISKNRIKHLLELRRSGLLKASGDLDVEPEETEMSAWGD